ncbi:MAG TPA: cation transporter [Candidatus Limnocylindrales bacterium]|nr:cation transporter [Candidatus Limnocylindrales bacterium]
MDRSRLLSRALTLSVISIALSGVLGGVAVVVGVATGSLSLLGFGLDAAIDSVASIVLVWRFRAETREPHRAERVERLAELAVGGVLVVLAVYLAVAALSALAGGGHPEASPVRTALLVIALATLPALAIAKNRTARALGSGALRADSILTAIAALLALIGLISLVLDQIVGVAWADALGALIIAVVIAREGWASVRSARTHEPIGVE